MPQPISLARMVSVLAFLFAHFQVTALEPEDFLFFKVGHLTLRPQVAVAEVYNDNIFYQDQREVQDFITIVSPGLKLQLGRPEANYISLGYNMDQLFYLENPDLKTAQHTIDVRTHLDFDRFRVEGSDRVQFLSSPLGGVIERVVGPDGSVTIVSGNIDRTSWDDTYTFSYDIGEKTGIYLRGTHNFIDYQEGIGLYDLETWKGTGGFAFRAFPKTAFFGEVHYGQTTTEPNHPLLARNPELSFVGGYVGVRGNFTEKLTGSAKIGYEAREFSDGSEAPSEPVVDISLSHLFSPKRMLSLTYSRLNTVSVQYSRQTYTADSIGVQLVQMLGTSRKWQASVSGNYILYQYEQTQGGSNRTQYDYLRASINVAYYIQRWLTASAGYDFERVAGDSRGVIDYNVNRVTLRLAIGY